MQQAGWYEDLAKVGSAGEVLHKSLCLDAFIIGRVAWVQLDARVHYRHPLLLVAVQLLQESLHSCQTSRTAVTCFHSARLPAVRRNFEYSWTCPKQQTRSSMTSPKSCVLEELTVQDLDGDLRTPGTR